MALQIIWIVCLMTPFMINQCIANLSQDERNNIKLGLEVGKKAVSMNAPLGDLKPSNDFDDIGQMSSFLGATGGLLSLAFTFVAPKDYRELANMMKKFKQVNSKLDMITAKLDNVKSMITFEKQRAIYVRSATKINFGHKELINALNELQNAKCSSKSLCRRKKSRIASRYVKFFAVKYNLREILHGVTRKTSAFGDPLLSVVQKHFRCSIPKIDQFANSVLRLAFKAQQVILAHEKLLGSKHSITQSMNEWLSLIYELRTHRNKLRDYCYKNILKYMTADLRMKKFQRTSSSPRTNAQVNVAIKKLFDEKYSWLGFTVYSYAAWGSTWHDWKASNSNNGATVWYSPPSRNARKRNIFLSFVDKTGTYTKAKNSVSWALDHIAKAFPRFHKGEFRYVHKILGVFTRELKRAGVWKYISNINIRKNEGNFMITTDNTASYIRKMYYLNFFAGLVRRFRGKMKIYVVVNLKSTEKTGNLCRLKCKNKGLCKIKPYSKQQYCECKPYYQGTICEEHSKAQLAKTIDGMLAVTLKLPHLSDISFDINDLREFIGVSFVRLQSAISSLDASFEKKLSQLARKVEWASLITQYSHAIKGIKYFAHIFQLLHQNNKAKAEIGKQGKRLAADVLRTNTGIARQLFDLDRLLTGAKDSLLGHKPFLLVFMESKAGKPCTQAYKKAVDNCWTQLILLQQLGYFVWSQALEFAGQPTRNMALLYKKRVKRQLSIIEKATCQYKVKDSTNINCTGGFYLNPSMKIRNTCKRNYYVIGSLTTSCKRKVSNCKHCGCNIVGSRSQQCSNIHGKCQCKKPYYGKKCASRDCAWKNWSNFGPCMGCGYSAKKKRSRSVQTPKQGNGKVCPGSYVMFKKCFQGCCKNQFHCSNTKKCIHKSLWCNYDNDCGDKQDEFHCKERCRIRLGNRRHSRSIKDTTAPCNGALNGFRLVWAGRDVRWSTKCCMPFALNRFHSRRVWNHWTRYRRVYDLSKQTVNCGLYSFLRSFHINYSWPGKVRFEYVCQDRRVYGNRFHCVWKHTPWRKDGNGKKAYRLTNQIFNCPPRYFINLFHMKSKPTGSWTIAEGKWMHVYRCCRILP